MRIHMDKMLGAMLVIGTIGTAPLSAQVPADYPWHDQVAPSFTASVELDPATGDFLYRYRVANNAAAAQRITEIYFDALAVSPSGMTAPPNWFASFSPRTPVAAWSADGPVDPAWAPTHAMDNPSFQSEIAPGGSLAGFELQSPCAGAEVVYYVRGYNHDYYVEEASRAGDIPEWRDDAVNGTVLGPGDCDTVADWGNRRPAVDGFAGLVNFTDGATLPAGPVTIQVRFSRDGETVDAASFRAELNREDVTSAFLTNSRGDRVAVFTIGTSPLARGRNVLLVSVDGLVPGTTRTATDADRFTFTVP